MATKGTKTGKSSVFKSKEPVFGYTPKGQAVTKSKGSNGITWYSSKSAADKDYFSGKRKKGKSEEGQWVTVNGRHIFVSK